MKSRVLWKGYAMVLGATIIWSANFVIARELVDCLPPVTLAFLRWFCAVIIILPIGYSSLKREWFTIKNNLAHLSLAAFLGVTVFNTIVYYAARDSSAANLALFSICSPMFMILFARLFLRDTLTMRRAVGVALATFGALILVFKGEFSQFSSMSFSKSDLIMFANAGVFGLYGILVRMKTPQISSLGFLTSIFVLGTIFLVPFLVWELSGAVLTMPNVNAWLMILYLGIGPSLIAFYLWNGAIATIGPVRTGLIYYSLPMFSGLEAYLLLHEPLTYVHAVSGACILTGIITATKE